MPKPVKVPIRARISSAARQSEGKDKGGKTALRGQV